jgi:hypothetical protein
MPGLQIKIKTFIGVVKSIDIIAVLNHASSSAGPFSQAPLPPLPLPGKKITEGGKI